MKRRKKKNRDKGKFPFLQQALFSVVCGSSRLCCVKAAFYGSTSRGEHKLLVSTVIPSVLSGKLEHMATSSAEWTIANFSCWNNAVHGSKITSPAFTLVGMRRQFQLFEDSNEKIGVKLTGNNSPYVHAAYTGEVTIISSNGSVICTKKLEGDSGIPFSIIFSEFKFKDLVARIRENKAHHQNQLSVRCRFFNSNGKVVYLRTTIKVHQISVKVPFETFEKLIEGNPIQVIRFPFEADGNDRMQIELYEEANTYYPEFKIFGTSGRKILVWIHLSVLDKDDAVLKTIEKERVFINEGEKMSLITLTKEEVKEKQCSLFIDLKVIPPENCEYRGNLYVDESVYIALPNPGLSGSVLFVSPHKSSSIPKIITSSDSIDNDPVVVLSNSSSNSKIITSSNSIKDDPVAVLTKELMCLLQDHNFSDLQLNCGGMSLPVHKNILSARSPVFKRLLSSDMREAVTGSVDIEDLDAPTLARFLAFLYTGSVIDLRVTSALKLYYAADKYEVPSLKSECVSILSAYVAVLNVCDVLSLADRHQDDQLRTVAHDFILRNFNEVLGSTEWENFIKRESLLAVNTVTVLARKNTVVFGTS